MIDAIAPPPDVPSPSIGEAEADIRLGRDRFDLVALLAKADHRFIAGDHRGASAFYAFAAKTFDAAGSPEVRRATDMRDWLAERFRHHIVSAIEASGFAIDTWPTRFRTALEIMFGDRQRDLVTAPFPQMPRLFFYPDLPYVDFADVTGFAWRETLEGRYLELREEASGLLADTSDFSPYVQRTTAHPQGDVHGLLENPDWSSLYLWNNGKPVEETIARCPRTFDAVSQIVPLCDIGRMAPAVLFSLLKAGAHIPPHTGMLNVRYICHLPLIVPSDCSFRVGERTVTWEEGKLLAFDDTVEHEARNGSSQDRLVLIFDVWNPYLCEDEKRIIRRMLEIVDDYR
jgi:aspartyl/asparaginyl beta-hydroxylase (cupin superfamily)